MLLCTVALAQDATFRTGVKEVLVPVVVRDSAGRPVGGLKAEDFQLFDRGKRQTIRSFSALADIGSVSPNGSTGAGAADSSEPHEPGAVSAKPAAQERSVAYVFDDVNTGFAEFARTRAAALRYFHDGLAPGEVAAIYSFSGRTSLPFTTDHQKLEDAVNKLRVSLTPGHGDANPCPYVSYYLADFIVRRNNTRALEVATQQTMDCMPTKDHDMAERIALGAAQRERLIGDQDIRLWAAALRRVIRLLQERPAPRVLVLASSGLYSQTPLGIRAIAETLDLAARAGVTISTLHARGVYTMAQADAMRRSYPSALERGYYSDSAYAEENTLADLANGTGDTYFRHNNDLATGFAQLAAPPQYSYVLGFSPAPLKPDGGFHALKVRLPGRGGVSVEARPGYYAPKAPKKGRAEDLVAEEIDDAVQARDEATGIPLDAAVQTVRAGKADARLSVLAKVHVKPQQFQKVEGRNHDVLTVVTVVFDQDGGYVVGNRNTVNLMFRDETLAGREDPAVNVQSNFEVRPGNYLVRVVVCDQGGGDLSSRNVRVVVR